MLRSGVVVAAALVAGLTTEAGVPYRHLDEIPVAGEGGWDYLTIDAPAQRLYVTHATRIVMIDIAKDAVVGEIDDTPGVHGIALATPLGRGFTSDGRENKVGVVDLATHRILAKIDVGGNPDAILFEPKRREVYAFNGRSHSVTVIDAASNRVVATTPLGGKPEFAATDAEGRVFVAIEDRNEVSVLDTGDHAVAAHWATDPGEEPSAVAIDAAHHRLFVGCGNEQLVVLDTDSGRKVSVIPAGKGIDAVVFDPGTQLAFAANGRDGTVTIAHEDTPEKFTVVQTLTTERSARTMAVDPSTHKIYLVAARFQPAETGKRAKMIAGSMRVLVYGF